MPGCPVEANGGARARRTHECPERSGSARRQFARAQRHAGVQGFLHAKVAGAERDAEISALHTACDWVNATGAMRAVFSPHTAVPPTRHQSRGSG